MSSRDPGREQEDTTEEDTFNSLYPIDPDYMCNWIEPGDYVAWELLAKFKKGLPYLLRYHRITSESNEQSDLDAEQELKSTKISVPALRLTARSLLREIAKQLPRGWQATQFPGRLILYKEQKQYRRGLRIWPKA